MTGYQITARDLDGFKKYNAGIVAKQRFAEYQRFAQKNKLTPADRLARIEALDRKRGMRKLFSKSALVELVSERANSGIRAEKIKGSFPAVSAVLTLVFACILSMVVYSSVQYASARQEYVNARSALNASTAEINLLVAENDARIDLDRIEEIAVNDYGMIKKDKAENVFISVKAGDRVEIYNTDSDDKADASLLSAFSERLRSLWEYFN